MRLCLSFVLPLGQTHGSPYPAPVPACRPHHAPDGSLASGPSPSSARSSTSRPAPCCGRSASPTAPGCSSAKSVTPASYRCAPPGSGCHGRSPSQCSSPSSNSVSTTGSATAPADGPVGGAAILRILLAGNPNTGKTTLFNRLCGTRAKTSNFPGTTTASRVGRAALPGEWMAENHRPAGPLRTRPGRARTRIARVC